MRRVRAEKIMFVVVTVRVTVMLLFDDASGPTTDGGGDELPPVTARVAV
jgi:hypothetical protein